MSAIFWNDSNLLKDPTSFSHIFYVSKFIVTVFTAGLYIYRTFYFYFY